MGNEVEESWEEEKWVESRYLFGYCVSIVANRWEQKYR